MRAYKMRILEILLAIACVSALPAMGAGEAKDANDEANRVQTVLARVGKMAPAEQQKWLRRLEERAARSARLTLKPDEAAREQAKTHAKLHQKMLGWTILREVVDETSARERDAIDRLVHHYRSLVFDSFHKQIEVYGQRQQAWLDVNLAWRLAGSPFDQQDRLIDWLEEAIRSAAPEKIGPIPEKPTFESETPAEEVKP
jgi:hypothetical protein